MPEEKSKSPKGPYYVGRTHFSYNNDLAYHARPYNGVSTFQDMVKRAEQTMSDSQFKN